MVRLHGLPMTIKDSSRHCRCYINWRDDGPSGFCTRTRRNSSLLACASAGAILLGKTNTPEFTMSFETDNLVYGRTSNPYDPARTSGGSSGGAAAIIAVGGAPFDIGSDYGGSIRLPAHCCGITGIKPTSGRVPRTGHALPFGGLLDSFQQLGPLARCVDDLNLLLPLIAGPDWIDPAIVPMPLSDPAGVELKKLRIAFHTITALCRQHRNNCHGQEGRRCSVRLGAAGRRSSACWYRAELRPDDGAEYGRW